MNPPHGRRKERPASLSAHFAESAILEAAMTVFTQHGIQQTRVEDLITAAGISRRTFYKYFGSKEEVLAALYELVTGKLLEMIRATSVGRDPGLEEIRIGIDAYLEFHAINGRLLRLLVEQAMRSDSLLYPRRTWLRSELVKILSTAVHNASGRRLDAMVFQALISMLEGLSLHLLESGAGQAGIARAKRILHGLTAELLGPTGTLLRGLPEDS